MNILEEKGQSVSSMESVDKIQLLSKKLDTEFDLLELWYNMDTETKVLQIESIIKLLAQFWIETGSNMENKNNCDLKKLTEVVEYKNAVSFLRDQFVDMSIRDAYDVQRPLIEYYEEIAKPVDNPLMATIGLVNPAKEGFMNKPKISSSPEHLWHVVTGILSKNGFNSQAAEEYATTYVDQYGDDAPDYAKDIYPEDVDID